MGFPKGVQSRSLEPCLGFLAPVGNVEAMIDKVDVKIFTNGRLYRSAECVGSYQKIRRASMCFACKAAKKKVDDRLSGVRSKKQLCSGVETATYNWLIEKRRWETDRRQNSVAIFIGNRAFSKRCTGTKAEENRTWCLHCRRLKATLNALCSKDRRRPTTEENRIRHSNTKYLTASDEQEKLKLLVKRRNLTIQRVRHVDARCKRLQRQVRLYRPEHAFNWKPARSLVAHLNSTTNTVTNPFCRWMDGGRPCMFRTDSCQALLRHLSSVHLQAEWMKTNHAHPPDRHITCRWENCRRKASFKKRKQAFRHLQSHSGSREAVRSLLLLREQLINLGRAPTGRRWSRSAKSGVMVHYRSRRSYERVRKLCPLPLPSSRTLDVERNAGTIVSGVDETVLELMAEISKDQRHLRHGILVFDEIHIRKTATFHSNSKLLYGFADDRPGGLAKSMLVFQYISLFDRRRFRANVAWFAVDALNQHTLFHWFMQVGLALKSHGIELHGLLSDGASCNRGFVRTLAEQYGDAKTCADSGIESPFSDTVDRFFLLSDPSHILKKLRSSWNNPKKTMHYNGDIRWAHLYAVYNWQQHRESIGLRIDRPLTQLHVRLQSFEKMIVRTAVDIVSEPIEKAMESIPGTEATRWFMKLARTFWNTMNQRQTLIAHDAARPSCSNLRHVLSELTKWHDVASGNKKAFITLECFEDVSLACRGVPSLIDHIFTQMSTIHNIEPQFTFKLLTQDFLEKDFGELRQRCGGGNNPTIKSAAYVLRSMNMSRLNKFKQQSVILCGG